MTASGTSLTETNASNGDRFKFAGMEYDSVQRGSILIARGYYVSSGKIVADAGWYSHWLTLIY